MLGLDGVPALGCGGSGNETVDCRKCRNGSYLSLIRVSYEVI
jgi:hypothetical protein